MNNNIVEMINDPANSSVIGFNKRSRDNSVSYFVCIKNIRKSTNENFSITKEEIPLYEKAIKDSDNKKSEKKAQRKEDRRLREEARFKQADTFKSGENLGLTFSKEDDEEEETD